MSLFITEAAVVGAKEAAKLALVWFLLSSFLKDRNRKDLIIPFYAGIALASLTPAVIFFLSPAIWMKDFLSRLIGYVFFIFMFGSVAVFYGASGRDVTGSRLSAGWFLRPLVLLLSIFYFLPDIAGTSMHVKELGFMKENMGGAYLSAISGFVLTATVVYVILRRFISNAGRYFDVSRLLLSLALLKLMTGGIRGFAELSLIPSVKRGVMKFVHDVVHQTFVVLLVPDHPMLKTTTWDFIGFFFGSNFAIVLTLVILLLPPVIFLYYGITVPLPEPVGEGLTGADRRRFKAQIRTDRVRKAIPTAFLSWWY